MGRGDQERWRIRTGSVGPARHGYQLASRPRRPFKAVDRSAAQLDITLEFKGQGDAEVGVVTQVTGNKAKAVLRYKGFRFFFYSNEGRPREPVYVHVRTGSRCRIRAQSNGQSLGSAGRRYLDRRSADRPW